MHFLCIQVQPNLLAAFNEHAIDQLRALEAAEGSVQSVEVQHGEDDGAYFNVIFGTPDPRALWPSVREELVRLGLHGASIATCTGSCGWDNYLLLHHFSREVPTERFSAP